MLENKLRMLMYLMNTLWLIAAFVISFVYIRKTGRFFKGFTHCWMMNVFAAVMMVAITYIFMIQYPQDKQTILRYFPDGPFVTAALVLGWLPALLISAIAYGVYRLTKTIKLRKTIIKPSELNKENSEN